MSRKTVERNISYDTQRKVYYVCLDGGLNANRKRCRCYRTTPTLREARALLHRFTEQKLRGRSIRPTSQTLGEWLEYWIYDVIAPTRAATTTYCYKKIIDNHMTPALGHIPLQRLTPRDIQHYYITLLREKRLSPNTIRKHHDLLAAALHTAEKQDIILSCPTDRAEPPRLLPAEPLFYSEEDLRRLFALVRNTPLELPVRLAGTLGLRREEVCGLKWSQVDFEQRLIHIRFVRTCAGSQIIEKEPKNSTSLRTLHMNHDLFLLLTEEAWRQQTLRQALGDAWPDSGFVLVNDQGAPPSPNALSTSFTLFIRQHGLPPLTLHGLRHSFATVACHQGAPLFEISKALGHSTPSTTGKIYTHLTDCTHAGVLTRVADAVHR